MMNIGDIEIIVKLTSSENSENSMKAIIALNFGGVFKIKGFRVQGSKYANATGEKVWVTPPSYFSKGGYHLIFFSENKEWWKRLETKILNAYNVACMNDVLEHSNS